AWRQGQGAVTANVVIIIEACYSGSFINPLSGQNRVILTSAGGEPYNTDSAGQISFSRRFFSKLMEGESFKKAFEYARTMQINMNYPSPQLDDNGDGASNASDGLLASNIYLNGQLTWGLKPTIGPVGVARNLENAISTPISVVVIKGDVNIEKVWVQIIAPNANIGGGVDTITYPEVVLTKTGTKEQMEQYEGVLNDLRVSGMYQLVILASDANKEISDPVIAYINVDKNAKPGDINGDGSITIADAILAMQVLAGMRPEGLPAAALSDVNGDGKIGLPEVIYIMQTAAGLR
ncbi:MAG: dockerin type I domain-containing protein, partial [Holophaga sp.]|nr:dockerin type I domain-containing protein [Holophaga sp.]